MADRRTKLRLALSEIEGLIAAAESGGTPIDPWVEQVARELRSAIDQDRAESASEIAGLMRSEPVRSLSAQARLAATALRSLRS